MLKREYPGWPLRQLPGYSQYLQLWPGTHIQSIHKPIQRQMVNLPQGVKPLDKRLGEPRIACLQRQFLEAWQFSQGGGYRVHVALDITQLQSLHTGETLHKTGTRFTQHQVYVELYCPDMREVGVQSREITHRPEVKVGRGLRIAQQACSPTGNHPVCHRLTFPVVARTHPALQRGAQTLQFALLIGQKVKQVLSRLAPTLPVVKIAAGRLVSHVRVDGAHSGE